MASQLLLCTFCDLDTLDETIKNITEAYTVLFDTIYVLDNVDSPNSVCCTYNIDSSVPIKTTIPSMTISLHRKKSANCLYTINSINLLIQELNGGILDKSYKIPWQNYTNSILVSAYGKLKIIKTKLNKKVKISELGA